MSTMKSEIKRLPGETKEEAELREAHERAYEAFKRERCTYWEFWALCRHKACGRHRACVGAVERCFDRHWPLVAPQPRTAPEDRAPRVRML